MLEHCGCTPAKCNKSPKGKMCPKHGMEDCTVKEGNLHQWFKGSKSSDGKPGWVNVVTGGTCASDEPGEGTPKCVSSSKRASMSKSERLSASRRKKSADPGQQSKSGAAKPTYVSTDVKEDWTDKYKKSIDCNNPKGFSQRAHCQGRKKKMQEQSFSINVAGHKDAQRQQKIRNLATGTNNPNEKAAAQKKLSGPSLPLADEYVIEGEDVKGKGSGKKDACYNKVKSRYDVWPSAYASGALVKCRKVGAKNWGNKSEDFIPEDHKEIASGKKVDDEGYMANLELDQMERSIQMLRRVIKDPKMQLPAWVQSKITRAADFVDTAAEYMTSDEEVSEACWQGYTAKGMKKKGNRMVPNCVPTNEEFVDPEHGEAPSGRSPLQNVSDHPNPKVRKKAVKGFKKQMSKEYGGKWKSRGDDPVKEDYSRIQQFGQTYTIILTWHASTYKLQVFFPKSGTPTRQEVEDAIHKVYPGALLNAYMPSRIDPTKPMILTQEETEIDEAVLGRYKEDRGGGKTLRPASERLKPKTKKPEPKPEGPKITKLKPRGPRKGEATASQVQGWRGSDRTNTNRSGQSSPQAKVAMREEKSASKGAENKFHLKLDKLVHGTFGPSPEEKKKIKKESVEESLAIVFDPEKEKKRKNYLLNIGVVGEDWQSVNRKDKTDGLSQKAVNAYRRENPGSKLQTAVTEKNPSGKRASRRKSFCSRMGGMKSKLTSSKTANDPDSRINKALRRWNCS